MEREAERAPANRVGGSFFFWVALPAVVTEGHAQGRVGPRPWLE